MKRLLIVDDEEKICVFLSCFFERCGFEVESTTSPAEAVNRVAGCRPDLMLLDVRMSPVSGLEVLKRVKAVSPQLCVVMISALEDEWIIKEAMDLGAADYVAKPLVLDPRWWAERFFGIC